MRPRTLHRVQQKETAAAAAAAASATSAVKVEQDVDELDEEKKQQAPSYEETAMHAALRHPCFSDVCVRRLFFERWRSMCERVNEWWPEKMFPGRIGTLASGRLATCVGHADNVIDGRTWIAARVEEWRAAAHAGPRSCEKCKDKSSC